MDDPSTLSSDTSDPSTEESRAPGRRLLWSGLLFIALTLAGLTVVYLQFADKSVSFDWRLLAPQTLLAVATLLLVYFISDGLRLYCTLRALGYGLPFKKVFKLVFINLFFANVTPMATGGGFAQIWYLQRHGVPLGYATAATTIRTVLAVIFIFSLTPFFLMTLEVLQKQTLLSDLAMALAVFITLYLGFFAVVLFRTRWLIGPLCTLISWLHRVRLLSDTRQRRWLYKIKREMLEFSQSFAEYLRGPKHWVLLSVVSTCVFLLSLFSIPALLIYSLGYEVDYLTTLGLLVVTTFIMYVSPTPGASGISEGVFGTFFQATLTANHLILVIIGWRFLTIYLGMLVGLMIVQRELHAGRKEQQ
ncbi:lysylphosphatidylglycerol synthase transmembrane domain-containing protein [Marinobacter sp. X15-166B]|uniref:lysylphosphatidylglycerol synthase transmembrane domain-containing protein n=1 Tax=Marinobacter sp. X15-166B TaxID=1897620 RepID=UPI00085C782E|nr:lysylphosphatidylglycerol synthase transmembrane domain-containing protein [Marinobacter sp. X15-166B]OEY67882.1 hypothetical protein BG841_02685 [Marinobacter sp. X15-166B]